MQNKIKMYYQPHGETNGYLIETDFASASLFFNAIYNFGGTNSELQDRGSGKAFYFFAKPDKFKKALSVALTNNLEFSMGEGDWEYHASALADEIISEIKPALFLNTYHRRRYLFDKRLDESEKSDKFKV